MKLVRSFYFLSCLLMGGAIATPAFAQYANEICAPLASNRNWTSNNAYTVNWRQVNADLPEYLMAAQQSATDRQQMLRRLSHFNRTPAQVREYVRAENLRDCRIDNIRRAPNNVCFNFELYCVVDQSTTQMAKQMETFSKCAQMYRGMVLNQRVAGTVHTRGRNEVPTRATIQSDCGPSFLTHEGIRSNLETLQGNLGSIEGIIRQRASYQRNPALSQFLSSINKTFDEVLQSVRRHKGDMQTVLNDLEADRRRRQAAADAELRVLRRAQAILNNCPAYLESEGVKDMGHATDVMACPLDEGDTNKSAVRNLIRQLKNIETSAGQEALVELTDAALVSSLRDNIRGYLQLHKAIHGNLPSCETFSQKACQSPAVRRIFGEVSRSEDVTSTPRLNFSNQVKNYLELRESNKTACQIQKNPNESPERKAWAERAIAQSREYMMDNAVMKLISLDSFRSRYPIRDSECAKGESIFPQIKRLGGLESDADAGRRFGGMTLELLPQFVAGAEEIVEDQKSVSDKSSRARDILEPLLAGNTTIVMDALDTADDPEAAALWMCRLLRDESKERRNLRGVSMAAKGVGLAAGVASIVFSGGTATPLVLAGVGAASVGGGAVLDYRMARHEVDVAQEALLLGYADPYLTLNNLKAADRSARLALSELALAVIPPAGFAARGAIISARAAGTAARTGTTAASVATSVGRLQGTSNVSNEAARSLRTALSSVDAAADTGLDAHNIILKKLWERMSPNAGTPSATKMSRIIEAVRTEVPLEVGMEFLAYVAIAQENPFSEHGLQTLLTSALLSTAFAGAQAADLRSVLQRFRSTTPGSGRQVAAGAGNNSEAPGLVVSSSRAELSAAREDLRRSTQNSDTAGQARSRARIAELERRIASENNGNRNSDRSNGEEPTRMTDEIAQDLVRYKTDSEYAPLFRGDEMYEGHHAELALVIRAMEDGRPRMSKPDIKRRIEETLNSCQL